MLMGRSLRKLLGDAGGTMAIETALIAPLLAMMALGVFEVSRIVSREQQKHLREHQARRMKGLGSDRNLYFFWVSYGEFHHSKSSC